MKDGIPLGDYTHSQYHKIQNTHRKDSGSYQCLAKNEAGVIFSKKIEVIVACKFSNLNFILFNSKNNNTKLF